MSFPGHKLRSGWGVIRRAPWHLAGVYEISAEAETRVAQLGPEYKIRYGENRLGSDEFVWSEPGTV